jgi:nitroreductase
MGPTNAARDRISPFEFNQLIRSRSSTRAFLPRHVPEELLKELLYSARQAPSGANLQPGAFIDLREAARERLTANLLRAYRSGEQEQEDYSYFPQPMPTMLRRRQVAAARALYGALNMGRDDVQRRSEQFERNFNFFGAPVALLVTIQADFGSGGYMDLGMSLYGLMLAAHAHGLASCAIGAMASYPKRIRNTLGLTGDTHIVCGLALGYADLAAPVNRARTERCELNDYYRVIR